MQPHSQESGCFSVFLTVFYSLQEFEVLSQIRVLQASCSQYNLPHHPRIAAWLQGHRLLTDQERWTADNVLFTLSYNIVVLQAVEGML